MRSPQSREQRFVALYDEVRPELLRFVQRRVEGEVAEDVVAEAFVVVWRRLDEVPAATGDARAWVYGVARHVLLNHRRGHGRHTALGVRLAEEDLTRWDTSGHDLEDVAARLDVARAWWRLSHVHQEALGLVVFDDLDAPRAAAVLGISPVAFRLRLSRARRALRLHLDHQPATSASRPLGPAAPMTTLRSVR